ncbi:MAG: transporter substrate-binding domain-containing protein, partial [bacterium]
MKKTISLLLSAVLLFTLFGCGAKETAQQEPSAANTEAAAPTNETAGNAENAETLDLLGRIQKAGVITIATEGVWAPWTYHDESGALTGMDVELGRLIAAELGVEAQFAETNWDSILAGVSAGRFDLAING